MLQDVSRGTASLALTSPELRLRSVLRVFVVLFALGALIYGLGPFIGPYTGFMRRLPFVAFSVVKVFTLLLACLYAAGDPRDRLGLVWVAVGGHVISVAAMLVLLAAADVSTPVLLGSRTLSLSSVLWSAIALDGVICVLLGWFGWNAARAIKEARPEPQQPGWTVGELTPADRTLARFLFGLGVLFVLGAVVYEAGPLLPATREAFTNLPFVTNSVVKVGTLALVAFYVARDIGPRIGVTGILFVAHVVSVLTQLLFLLGAGGETAMSLGGREVAVRSVLLGGAVLDAGIAALILFFWRRAYRARFRPEFLTLRGYRTLIALADVVVHGPDEQVSPREIAHHVDRYFQGIHSARGRLANHVALAVMHFHPVAYLKPPFPELSAAARMEHLKQHFYLDVALKLIPGWWRTFVRGMIRVGKQLAYVGYYTDREADKAVGYVRFRDRERTKGLDLAPPEPHRLKVTTPGELRNLHEEADVCVIGSGAAGAILAYHLAKEGLSVIVLERGRYVPPAEFSDDEVGMIGKLYDDGVFQQTRDLNFTILQGSCVGGSTVVNNAVCFRPPEAVVQRWNDRWRWNAGIDFAQLDASAAAIEQWLPITSQSDAPLNPSSREYLEGVRKLGLDPSDLEVRPVNANIRECLGCGYCNMGCAFGRKLSMLDTVLPWAQRDFSGRVRIFAEAPAQRIVASDGGSGGRRAGVVQAKLWDGRVLTVRAQKVVVAAGAIASPWLLMQSGIGRGLPVGRGMSFNMGAPLTAEFERRMNAYDGLQISHYGRPRPERGWVFETWWNPPVAQALNMPGWFERHFDNMRRYPYLMAVGALVGTEGNAHVARALTGGPEVVYEPTPGDRRKLADALIELGRILFAAGAKRIMVNTWNYYEFTDPNQLSELIRVTLDPEELVLGTGHPQGGNAISASPEWGVVGPDFRVHGWENLYVCDASVIPSSLTVNPQLTIMTLAHYAAPRIAGRP